MLSALSFEALRHVNTGLTLMDLDVDEDFVSLTSDVMTVSVQGVECEGDRSFWCRCETCNTRLQDFWSSLQHAKDRKFRLDMFFDRLPEFVNPAFLSLMDPLLSVRRVLSGGCWIQVRRQQSCLKLMQVHTPSL